MSSNKAPGRPTVAEKKVSSYLYEFIKSYLYLLSIGDHAESELEVPSLTGYSGSTSRRPTLVSVSDDLGGKFLRVADPVLTATLSYRGGKYHASVFDTIEDLSQISYYIHVLGDGDSAGDAQALIDQLVKECIRTCPYQNQTLVAGSDNTSGQAIELGDLELGDDDLDEIFLPVAVRRDLDLFISALTHFDRARIPLRYLLSGRPGTGKTKIIRAVANACKGKATFLFANGAEQLVPELFDIASMFSPVVLCIDDIDMLTGSRRAGNHNHQLATFLQRLDGFASNGLFLLATTNDKALVDLAASRPGRFDRILDVSVIEPEHYMALVTSKSPNPALIGQFDEEILGLLKRKRVSGAFIATLVKHLELVSTFDPSRLNKDYVRETIEGSFDGFYKENQEGRADVGFRAA